MGVALSTDPGSRVPAARYRPTRRRIHTLAFEVTAGVRDGGLVHMASEPE